MVAALGGLVTRRRFFVALALRLPEQMNNLSVDGAVIRRRRVLYPLVDVNRHSHRDRLVFLFHLHLLSLIITQTMQNSCRCIQNGL